VEDTVEDTMEDTVEDTVIDRSEHAGALLRLAMVKGWPGAFPVATAVNPPRHRFDIVPS
jgi:hypothetical protein